MNEHDHFESLFVPEQPQTGITDVAIPWKILLIDDEADIHAVLHLALQNILMDGRPVQLLDAYSAAEAKVLLAEHPDTALILLDVVMETEQAGLELVNYIRHDLNNSTMQIMVITGQPGYAPQRDVVVRYEIDDYRLKSDLNADKLFTAVYASLRAFKTLTELEAQHSLLAMQTRDLARWGHIFEHAEWGIFVSNFDGQRIELCNPAFASQRGFTVDEVLQMRPDQLFTPEERDKLPDYMKKAHDLGHIIFESLHLRKDSSTFPVLADATVVKDAQGRMLYRVVNVQDITERKKAEEEKHQLEKLTWQLQKNQSLNRMAGGIAHHFNNHLGAAIGNLEMAIDDLPKQTEPARRLARALEAVLKTTEISGQLLSYLGQVTGENAEHNLSEICRRILLVLQTVTPKNVIFMEDLPTPGPTIKAKANQIEQVVANLVTNAFEAIGDKQGTTHLKIKKVSPVDIPTNHLFPLNWRPEGKNHACIEVTDTGCGITNEAINKLFDPFYSTKFPGRGLGLSTALGIVTVHGGAFAVASEIGRGSTFRVFLPISTENTAPKPMQQPVQVSTNKAGAMVLLVEDEEIVRDMAQAMLTRLGFRVITATDGIEAVKLFKNHSDTIDLVLCDLNMPRMNGWQTVTALRLIRPALPVVLTSGHDEATIKDGVLFKDTQIILHKPYQKSALKEALEKALATTFSSN